MMEYVLEMGTLMRMQVVSIPYLGCVYLSGSVVELLCDRSAIVGLMLMSVVYN